MAFHDIAKQLESSHVQVVEWKSPTGDMQFKRSSAKTEYEKLEMQFVNQVAFRDMLPELIVLV